MTDLDQIPDASYLRVFHAPRALSASEQERVCAAMRAFMNEWVSHEQPVRGAFELRHDRFLLVAADESADALSGCSKDSLIGRVRALSSEIGVDLVHGPPVCFRDGAEIRCVDREGFGELVREGAVGEDTVVFDTTLHTVGALRAGRFELPAKESWHARAWDLGKTSATG